MSAPSLARLRRIAAERGDGEDFDQAIAVARWQGHRGCGLRMRAVDYLRAAYGKSGTMRALRGMDALPGGEDALPAPAWRRAVDVLEARLDLGHLLDRARRTGAIEEHDLGTLVAHRIGGATLAELARHGGVTESAASLRASRALAQLGELVRTGAIAARRRPGRPRRRAGPS